ncbi:hypothetical protein LTS18_002984 [Coniosporium uncinatum]|uniref:Uncharacterized protein n=1 Tax=Coniosporium uncinatum TaxID=93489 RepID=A0ACC3D7W0_9PEZI|nr:hypothetical protein LTS18_002984 [Coniosporium uncinatum]
MGCTTSDLEQELHALLEMKESNPDCLLNAKTFIKAYLQRLKAFKTEVPNKATRLAKQLYDPKNDAVTAKHILELVNLIGKELEGKQELSLAKEIKDALKGLFHSPETAAPVVIKEKVRNKKSRDAETGDETDIIDTRSRVQSISPKVNEADHLSLSTQSPKKSESDAGKTVTANGEEDVEGKKESDEPTEYHKTKLKAGGSIACGEIDSGEGDKDSTMAEEDETYYSGADRATPDLPSLCFDDTEDDWDKTDASLIVSEAVRDQLLPGSPIIGDAATLNDSPILFKVTPVGQDVRHKRVDSGVSSLDLHAATPSEPAKPFQSRDAVAWDIGEAITHFNEWDEADLSTIEHGLVVEEEHEQVLWATERHDATLDADLPIFEAVDAEPDFAETASNARAEAWQYLVEQQPEHYATINAKVLDTCVSQQRLRASFGPTLAYACPDAIEAYEQKMAELGQALSILEAELLELVEQEVRNVACDRNVPAAWCSNVEWLWQSLASFHQKEMYRLAPQVWMKNFELDEQNGNEAIIWPALNATPEKHQPYPEALERQQEQMKKQELFQMSALGKVDMYHDHDYVEDGEPSEDGSFGKPVEPSNKRMLRTYNQAGLRLFSRDVTEELEERDAESVSDGVAFEPAPETWVTDRRFMEYRSYKKITTWIDAVEAETDRPSEMATVSPWIEAQVLDQVRIQCPKNHNIPAFLAKEARRDAGESVSDDTGSELSDSSKDSDDEESSCGSASSGGRDEAIYHGIDGLHEVREMTESSLDDEEDEPEEEPHPMIEAIKSQTIAMQEARRNRIIKGLNNNFVLSNDNGSEKTGSEKMRLKRETVEGHSGERGFGGFVPAGHVKLVLLEQVVCGGKQWEV